MKTKPNIRKEGSMVPSFSFLPTPESNSEYLLNLTLGCSRRGIDNVDQLIGNLTPSNRSKMIKTGIAIMNGEITVDRYMQRLLKLLSQQAKKEIILPNIVYQDCIDRLRVSHLIKESKTYLGSMTKAEKAKQLKLQLESLTGKKVRLTEASAINWLTKAKLKGEVYIRWIRLFEVIQPIINQAPSELNLTGLDQSTKGELKFNLYVDIKNRNSFKGNVEEANKLIVAHCDQILHQLSAISTTVGIKFVHNLDRITHYSTKMVETGWFSFSIKIF